MAILNKRWRKPCAKDTGNIGHQRYRTKPNKKHNTEY